MTVPAAINESDKSGKSTGASAELLVFGCVLRAALAPSVSISRHLRRLEQLALAARPAPVPPSAASARGAGELVDGELWGLKEGLFVGAAIRLGTRGLRGKAAVEAGQQNDTYVLVGCHICGCGIRCYAPCPCSVCACRDSERVYARSRVIAGTHNQCAHPIARTHTRIHMHKQTHAHICVHIYTRTCTHMYVCMHAYMHACIHTHTHTHTHAHTHTHTQMRVNDLNVRFPGQDHVPDSRRSNSRWPAAPL